MAIAVRSKATFSKTSMVLYLDALEAGGRSPHTISRYRCMLQRFLTFLGSRPPSTGTIQSFLGTFKSVNTRALALITVRQWCKFLQRRGLIDKDPTTGILIPRTQRRSYAPISPREFERLRAALGSDEMKVFASVLYCVGSRVRETLELRAEDVSFDGDHGTLEFRARKGGQAGFAAFGPELTALLRPWAAGRTGKLFGMTYNEAHYALATSGQVAGIPGRVTPHRLRHVFITRAVDAGWSQLALQAQVGHRNSLSTERYYHPTRAALIEAMKRTAGEAPAPVRIQAPPRAREIAPPRNADAGTMAQVRGLERLMAKLATTEAPAGPERGRGRPRKVTTPRHVILRVDGTLSAVHVRALAQLLEQIAAQLS
jgi:integrase/recombinase XerD